MKKIVAGAVAFGMLLPLAASAQTSTSSIQSLLDQIKALQEQIVVLQNQQLQAFASLSVQLKQGDKGENVKILQQLLAQDSSIYPEGMITGFFGRLTAEAVKRFQKKHGFEQVGNVGPKTLKRLNEIFGRMGTSTKGEDNEGEDTDHNRPCTSNNGLHLGWFTGLGNIKHGHDHEGDDEQGDDNEDTKAPCNATTTPPVLDTTAPVISNLGASGITFNGATINWTTNENASGQVEYGTTTSYGTFSPLFSSLTTSHSIGLSGLASSTMYNFRVISKDASGNTATSSNMTFVTGTPDTTAPNISGVLVSPIGSTTATISFAVSESASGKVYYGTATPLNLGSALTVLNSTLQGTHVLNLTGLSASTTYYYVLEAKDASNNATTTAEASFTTTN